MIPAEAVEAALSALFPESEKVQGFTRAVQEPIVRTILEAAAPHMLTDAESGGWQIGFAVGYHKAWQASADELAEAFDQGQKSGMRHADRLVAAAKIGKSELAGPISPNPYRSQT